MTAITLAIGTLLIAAGVALQRTYKMVDVYKYVIGAELLLTGLWVIAMAIIFYLGG